MTDPQAWWRGYLERVNSGNDSLENHIFEGPPQPGFYARRAEARSKQFLPVFIDDDSTVWVAGKVSKTPQQDWEYAVKFPISPEEYDDLMEAISEHAI